MWWMLKNSRGRPDALLTVAVLGTVVVLAKVLVSGASYGGISFGTIDGGLVAAALAPTLGAYTLKRIKGGKPDHGEEPKS